MIYPRIASKHEKGDYFFIRREYDGRYRIWKHDGNASMYTDAILLDDGINLWERPIAFESAIKAYKYMKENIANLI